MASCTGGGNHGRKGSASPPNRHKAGAPRSRSRMAICASSAVAFVDQRQRNSVAAASVIKDGWREARVIASARGADPVDEHFRIIVEFIEDRVQERGRGDAAVMCPDGVTQRIASDGRPAAFVRDLISPTTHIMPLATNAAVTARSGSDDQDCTIPAAERAEPCRMSVRVDGQRREGMRT